MECAPEIAGDTGRREQAAAALARAIKNNVGISVSVHVHDPGLLERSAGKARRVLDRRTS